MHLRSGHRQLEGRKQQEIYLGAVDCAMCGRFTQRYTWRQARSSRRSSLTAASNSCNARAARSHAKTIRLATPLPLGSSSLAFHHAKSLWRGVIPRNSCFSSPRKLRLRRNDGRRYCTFRLDQ